MSMRDLERIARLDRDGAREMERRVRRMAEAGRLPVTAVAEYGRYLERVR